MACDQRTNTPGGRDGTRIADANPEETFYAIVAEHGEQASNLIEQANFQKLLGGLRPPVLDSGVLVRLVAAGDFQMGTRLMALGL